MNQNLLSRVLEFLQRKMWNKRWQRAVTCLAAVAVFGVTYALVLPAITMTNVHPTLFAEELSAWSGDELTVKVTAEAEEEKPAQTFVLKAEGEGADLSASYAFNEEGICVITDDEGKEIELHRSIREGKKDVVDYWFTLEPGTKTAFTLSLTDEVDENRFAELVQAVKQDSEEKDDTVETASASDAGKSETAASATSKNSGATASNAAKASVSNADVAEANAAAKADEEKIVTEKDDDGFEQILDGAVVNDLEVEEEESAEQTEIVAKLKVSAGFGKDYENAVKDAEKNADKRGDAELKLSWKDVVASAKAAPSSLTKYINGANIVVFYDETAMIPEGAVLSVEEFEKGSSEYEEYLLQTKLALADATGSDAERGVNDARFFDITILDEDGNEVEPASAVKVVITYDESLRMEEDEDLNVVHFRDEDPEVMKPGTVDEGAGVGGLSFTTNSFSVYAIVQTGVLKERILTADGNTYEVSLTYGPEAHIPSGAALSVSELLDADYDLYLSRTAEALSCAETELAYAKFLDISIMSGDDKIQPEAPVEVSVRLMDVDQPKNEFQVVHFDEQPEKVESTVKAVGDDTALNFEATGFSVYAIVDQIVGEGLTRKSAENEKYFVEVGYSEKAEVPENAELKVTLITPGSDPEHYMKRVDEMRAAVAEADVLEVMDIGLWAGDVEVEPKDTVQVVIRFKNQEVYQEGKKVSVGHFTEKGLDFVKEAVVDEKGEASFTTSSFSDFVIADDGTVTFKKPVQEDPNWIYRVPNSKPDDFTKALPYGTILVDDENLTFEESWFASTDTTHLYRSGNSVYLKYDNIPARTTVSLDGVECTITYPNKAKLHDGTVADMVFRFSNIVIENTATSKTNFGHDIFQGVASGDSWLQGSGNSALQVAYNFEMSIHRKNGEPVEGETVLFGMVDIDQPSYANRQYYEIKRLNGENVGQALDYGNGHGNGALVYYSVPITDPAEKLPLVNKAGAPLYYKADGSITTNEAESTGKRVTAKYKVVRNTSGGTFKDFILALEPVDWCESVTIISGEKSKAYIPSTNMLSFAYDPANGVKRMDAMRDDSTTMNTGFFMLCDSAGFSTRYTAYGGIGISVKSSELYYRITSSTGEGGTINTYDTDIEGNSVTYGPTTLTVPKGKNAQYDMIPEPFYHAKTITIWKDSYQHDDGPYTQKTVIPIDTLTWEQKDGYEITTYKEGKKSFTFTKRGNVITYVFSNVGNDWTIDVQWEKDTPVDSVVINKKWDDKSVSGGGTRPAHLYVHLLRTDEGNIDIEDTKNEVVTEIDPNKEGNLLWTKGSSVWTYIFKIPPEAQYGQFAIYEDAVKDYSSDNIGVDNKLTVTEFDEITEEGRKIRIYRATISNALQFGDLKFTKVTTGEGGVEQPVSGAEFTLFTDQMCDHPLEIEGVEVKASSNADGEVIFSEIPCGIFYMKETVVPTGYKANPTVYKVDIHREIEETTITVVNGGQTAGQLSGRPTSYMINNPVFDFNVILKKTDKNNTTANLAGAIFDLYSGNYKESPTEAVKLGTYTTGDNGTFTVEKIGNGTYSFVEVAAPDGYILGTDEPIVFWVNSEAEGDKAGYMKPNDQVYSFVISEEPRTGQAIFTLTVVNEKGKELPHTGGPGTGLYTLGGIVLLIASALLYGFKMKREERRCS